VPYTISGKCFFVGLGKSWGSRIPCVLGREWANVILPWANNRVCGAMVFQGLQYAQRREELQPLVWFYIDFASD
jgi:hypothetical protein